jgi:transcriptional regulator with XRE-family HTH domain
MNQTQFAQALGISQSSVANWERGRNVPDSKAIQQLVLVFGCNPSWLYEGKGDPVKKDQLFDNTINSEIHDAEVEVNLGTLRIPASVLPHVAGEISRIALEIDGLKRKIAEARPGEGIKPGEDMP